jgi:hypothetical protein
LLLTALLFSSVSLATSYFGPKLAKYDYVEGLLEGFYGGHMPQKVDVKITGRNTSGFNTSKMQITVSTKYIGSRMADTLAHETSHLALYNLTNGQSIQTKFRFIDEGMATVMATRTAEDPNIKKQKVMTSAEKNRRKGRLHFASAARWKQFFGNPNTNFNNLDWSAYDVGASFVYYIIDNYSEEELYTFCLSLGETKDFKASIQLVFGVSSAEMQKSWNKYVKSY